MRAYKYSVLKSVISSAAMDENCEWLTSRMNEAGSIGKRVVSVDTRVMDRGTGEPPAVAVILFVEESIEVPE